MRSRPPGYGSEAMALVAGGIWMTLDDASPRIRRTRRYVENAVNPRTVDPDYIPVLDPTAVCKHPRIDPDTFFPAQLGDATDRRARALCRVCPLAKACLDYAMRNRQLEGIWGGTSKADRDRMRG